MLWCILKWYCMVYIASSTCIYIYVGKTTIRITHNVIYVTKFINRNTVLSVNSVEFSYLLIWIVEKHCTYLKKSLTSSKWNFRSKNYNSDFLCNFVWLKNNIFWKIKMISAPSLNEIWKSWFHLFSRYIMAIQYL